MIVNLTDDEAEATVDALRLRANILDQHSGAFSNLPLTAGWIKETVANMTAVADRIESAKEAEWADRKAAYDSWQTQDMSEGEIRALYGDR